MKLKKRIHGVIIDLELRKIKDYSNFTLYQIYKPNNGVYVPLYKETFTMAQLKKLGRTKRFHKKRNVFLEEVV